jgi:hypothetical protein
MSVQGDSASQFKLFRILWFPLSINAMLLGAGAIIAFVAITWVACFATGDRKSAVPSASAFVPSVLELAKEGTWPGYATSEKDGKFLHHLLASNNPSDTDRMRARADEAQLRALFGEYVSERILDLSGEGEELANNRKELESDLKKSLPRYRIVFLVQLAAFLFLLSTFGVAICRLLALRIARDEYCPLSEAMGFAWRVKLTGLLYPLAVVLPLLLLAFCNQIAGWVVAIPFIGGIFGIVLYPLVIITCIIIALCLLVGVFCLGLLPAVIATERKGTYDSLGKIFNYVFARPIPVVLHGASVLAFLWVLCTLFIDHRLMERVLGFTMTPVFGGEETEAMLLGQTSVLEGWKWFYGWLFKILLVVYSLLLRGALISLTLGAFTALFLVLRQDVDGVSTSEVAKDPLHVRTIPPAPAPAAAPTPPTPEGDAPKA